MNLNEAALELLLGAIAVSESWTLGSSRRIFTRAMAKLTQEYPAPQRFATALSEFQARPAPIVPISIEADNAFDRLPSTGRRIATVRRYPPTQILFVMEDADAFRYLAEHNYTQEELDFFWGFAQAIHTLHEPVRRRNNPS